MTRLNSLAEVTDASPETPGNFVKRSNATISRQNSNPKNGPRRLNTRMVIGITRDEVRQNLVKVIDAWSVSRRHLSAGIGNTGEWKTERRVTRDSADSLGLTYRR